MLSVGIIDTGNGVALQGPSATYWTIGNAGLIQAAGSTAGDHRRRRSRQRNVVSATKRR